MSKADGRTPENTTERARIIVGVGASAGGLLACRELLSLLPEKCGLGIVVVQHLSPEHESHMPELLQRETALKVATAQDGELVAQDHVYVIPHDAELRIVDGFIRLSPRAASYSPQKAPIDIFFRSLAEYSGCLPVGVILSGTGSDGAMGLREIKAAGGIAFAQRLASANFDGMPQAAIDTGVVDAVLSPQEIADALLRIPKPSLQALKFREDEEPEKASSWEEQFRRVLPILRNASGIDFSRYKQGTLRRRTERRMLIHNIGSLESYISLLQRQPEEVQHLCQDFLVHVTRFFRDPEVFDGIAERLLPKITEKQNDDGAIRVWVVGCSTGEEVYSIAMVILEHLTSNCALRPVQIFGTDVSQEAIERARTGVYPDTIAADMSPERLARFFTREEGTYQINKKLRDICIFAKHDVTRDPPFSRMDLVLCRNLLIYLGPELQKRVLKVLHYALRPDCFLVLGASETAGPAGDLFSLVDKHLKIYSKKAGSALYDINFSHPELPRGIRTISTAKPLPSARPGDAVATQAREILINKYSLPGILIDSESRVLEIFGGTSDFRTAKIGHCYRRNPLEKDKEMLLFLIKRLDDDAHPFVFLHPNDVSGFLHAWLLILLRLMKRYANDVL